MNSILKSFELSDGEIARLSELCKLFSTDFGQQLKSDHELKSKDWGLLEDISQHLWNSEKSLEEKINLDFALFEKFPSYYHFLLPFYRIIKDKQTENENLKDVIWQNFMKFLGSENFYFSPVGYVLWVEFFEDPETQDETWNGLMRFSDDNFAVMKLLEYAGPVAYSLKEPIYKKLLPDKSTHESIFKSLLFSSFDLFGKSENDKALKLLLQLKIDSKTDHYPKLKKKLQA
jgi:hypothetical protein